MGRDHRNPNARPTPKPKPGGRHHRENPKAPRQARNNTKKIINTIRNNSIGSGRTSTPTATYNKPKTPNLPQFNTKSVPNNPTQQFSKPAFSGGFQFNIKDFQSKVKGTAGAERPRWKDIKKVGNEVKDRAKDVKDKAEEVKDKLFTGFENADPQKQLKYSPYKGTKRSKQIWDNFTSAALNSTPERQAALKVMQRYSTSPTVVEYATKNLIYSEDAFVDSDYFGDAVIGNKGKDNPYANYLNQYLGDDVEIDTQEEYDFYLKRSEEVQNWFDKWTKSEKVYSASLEAEDGFRDPFAYTTVIDENAPLPFWVEQTEENERKWRMYLSRSKNEIDAINTQGEHYHEVLKQDALNNVKLKEKGINGQVGNASEELEKEGAVNSFADALYDTIGAYSRGESFIDTGNFKDSYFGKAKNYIRDYWINPIRMGEWGTFFANRLFGAMDILDMPAKGVRATMAGTPHIWGDQKRMFLEQEDFVYSGGKEKQKQLMDLGAADLLYNTYSVAQGYNPNNDEKIKEALANLQKDPEIWAEYQKLAKEWQAFVPEKSALDNLKEAYSTPGKDFYLHTVGKGHLAKDMALYAALDPTLFVGGFARSAAKQGARSIAEVAINESLRNTIGNQTNIIGLRTFLKSDKDRKIVNRFINSLGHHNIIFKNSDAIDREVDFFTRNLLMSNNTYVNPANYKTFSDSLKTALNNRITNINGKVVAASPVGKTKASEALLRTVSAIGSTADSIDSALLKAAFPEPFLIKGAIQGSRWAMDNTIVGKFISDIYNIRRIDRQEAVQKLFGKAYKGTDNLTLDQIEHFNQIRNSTDSIDTSTELRCLGVAKSRLRLMEGSCDRVLNRLNRGTLTPDEALSRIRQELQYFAGKEQCKTLDDLDTIINTRFKGFFNGSMDDSLSAFKRAFQRVEDHVAIKRSNVRSNFLSEVRNAVSSEELYNVFVKYNDFLDYHDANILSDIRAVFDRNIPDSELVGILNKIDTVPKNKFNVKTPAITKESVDKAIGNSVVVDSVDTVSQMSVSSRVTISLLNKFIEKPEYRALKSVLDDENILGFSKLRKLLKYNESSYKLRYEEMMDILDSSFINAQIAHNFNLPNPVSDALDDLRLLRSNLSRRVETSIPSDSSGAIYRYQIDRMVMFDQLIHNNRVEKLFDFYEDNMRSLAEDLRYLDFSSVEVVEHLGLYQTLGQLNRSISTTNLFYRLNSTLDTVVNEQQKYAILDYMFGLTTQHNETVIKRLAGDSSFMDYGIDNALYSSFGECKIGIKNARARMADFNNDIWDKFRPEIESNPDLQKAIKELCDNTNDDPINYVNLQILQNILLDPNAIKYYNAKNKTNPVIFTHFSTSGMYSSNSAITGIGYKRWVDLSENASLKEIFDKLISQDNVSLKIAKEDSYFDNISPELLNKIYDTHLSLKHASYEEKLAAYKECFGVGSDGVVKSESDIIEEFCNYLNESSFVQQGKNKLRSGTPCVVVHDYEGFHMPFLSKRLSKYEDLPIVKEIYKDFNNIERHSYNSFDSLKRIVNDQTLTSEQKEAVRKLLLETAQDMDNLGQYFRFSDLEQITSQFSIIREYIKRGNIKYTNDNILKGLNNVFGDAKQIDDLLSGVKSACSDLKEISDYAGDYLLKRDTTSSRVSNIVSSDEAAVMSKTNPIRQSRSVDDLQYYLNMRTKIDLNNISSYFFSDESLIRSIGNMSFDNLEKMSDLANTVVNSKMFLLESAESYLSTFKPQLDQLIVALQNYVKAEDSSLAYIMFIKEPKTAVESYLICKKLFDDIIRYYYNVDLMNEYLQGLSKGKVNRTRFKQRLHMDFIDQYAPLNEIDNIDDLMHQDLLDLLEGNYDSLIYLKPNKLVEEGPFPDPFARSTYDELLDEVEIVRRYKQVYSEVKRDVRDVDHLDDLMIQQGIISKEDNKKVMLYNHVEDFLNSLNGVTPDVVESLRAIKAWRKDFAEHYRYIKLMTDGSFDKQKLINELLWNDTNCFVMYPNKFSAEFEDDFINFVRSIDEPFIDYNFEGGAFIVYIKKGYDVTEPYKKVRSISKCPYVRSERNSYEAIPFPEYKDIASSGFSKKSYELLKTVYKDIDYYSNGVSKGTIGKNLSMREYTDFFNSIPETRNRMCTPDAMLQHDMYRNPLYDPGFISSTDTSIFSDIQYAFKNLQRKTEDVKLTANLIFNNNSDSKVASLIENVTNREVIEYFGNTKDFVIARITPGKTDSGMFLRQIKPKTEADVELLRQSNAVVLPYEMYMKLQDTINFAEPNTVMAVLNKALVFYKAIQLFSPGTWVRNMIDATTKAVLETQEGGITGAFEMLRREQKAAKDYYIINKIRRAEKEYISEGTWASIAARYKLDLSWEEYRLMSGLLDRDSAIYSSMYKTSNEREKIISGETINLSMLDDKDIEKYWTRFDMNNNPSVLLDYNAFNMIRNGQMVPSDVLMQQYQDALRVLLTRIAEDDIPVYDRVVNRIFTPFHYSEIIPRYAQLSYLYDLGYSQNQAFRKIAETQFMTRPNAHFINKLEYVVPFATFKYNNALFWVRTLEENPNYFRLLEHIYGPIVNDSYEQMNNEYNTYDGWQKYMFQTGGVPVGSDGLYFKLNPSCFDVFNLFYGGVSKNAQILNPFLRFGMKYSTYMLGWNNKEFLKDLDYEYGLDSFLDDAIHLIPGLDKLYNTYEHINDRVFINDHKIVLTSPALVLFFPTLFGSGYDKKVRGQAEFEDYQAELEKNGLWFDCNKGKVVSLSEKNIIGANDPRNNWDDVEYFMYIHYGKVWDANVGKFVLVSEYTEGGLNQDFDFNSDPKAWDKLCEEYKNRFGKVFDYNIGRFVSEKDLSKGGLNDPDLKFNERARLYKEKFGLDWDANQNKFVDKEHFIPGGMNDITKINNPSDFAKLKAYRRALYGEVYERFDKPDKDGKHGEFVKKYEPTCVSLESLLLKAGRDDDYYQYIATSKIGGVLAKDCEIKDGFIKTKDGKFVLTWNKDYNQLVFNQFYDGSGFGFAFKNRYQRFAPRQYDKNIKKYPVNIRNYRGIYTKDPKYMDFFKYEFSNTGLFKRADSPHRIHRLLSGRVIPYGGPYNKFSFYTR